MSESRQISRAEYYFASSRVIKTRPGKSTRVFRLKNNNLSKLRGGVEKRGKRRRDESFSGAVESGKDGLRGRNGLNRPEKAKGRSTDTTLLRENREEEVAKRGNSNKGLQRIVNKVT